MSSTMTAARSNADMARWQRRSLWAGVIALGVCAIGAPFSPTQFFRAYLAAYLFYLGIALGSMVLSDGLSPDRRKLGVLDPAHSGGRHADTAALGLAVPADRLWNPLSLPLGTARRGGRQPATPVPAVLSRTAPISGFGRRSISSLWIAMAFLLAAGRARKTRRAIRGWRGRASNSARSAPCVYGISLHFAAVDWGMSLQPVFHSTIWGPLFASGQLLSALAFALVVLAWLVNRPPLAEVAFAARSATIWQACCYPADLVGLHGLVPVHAGLDRQLAGRRDLVSAPRSPAGSA